MLLLTTPFVKTDPESTNVADNKRQSINDYLAESTILLFLDILVESTILSHRGPCTISFSKIYHIMGLFRVLLLGSYKWDRVGIGLGSLCGAIV